MAMIIEIKRSANTELAGQVLFELDGYNSYCSRARVKKHIRRPEYYFSNVITRNFVENKEIYRENISIEPRFHLIWPEQEPI